ncbi:MAG: hypothetical protein LBS45_06625, partial [Synergistaceae bacterium]|nr:hypothetical protein [Synergistaceae bacterium]
MTNDEITRISQDDGEREKLMAQALEEVEKTLFNYGCGMTARGLNKAELSVLMHARNAQMDAPLSAEKINEL